MVIFSYCSLMGQILLGAAHTEADEKQSVRRGAMCSEAQELDPLLMEGEEGQGQRSDGNPVPPTRL